MWHRYAQLINPSLKRYGWVSNLPFLLKIPEKKRKKLSWCSSQIIWLLTISHTNFRVPTVLATVQKQLSFVLSMTFPQLLMPTKFLSWLVYPGHSSETAFLRIVNDILTASNSNQVSVLTLLDLLAAFDTTDHSILLCRLEQHFGVSGQAFSWFKSYLPNFQFVFLQAAVTPSYPRDWCARRLECKTGQACLWKLERHV